MSLTGASSPFDSVRLTFDQQDILEMLVKKGQLTPKGLAAHMGKADHEDVHSDCEAMRMLGLLGGGAQHGYRPAFKASDFHTYRNLHGQEHGSALIKEVALLRASKTVANR